MMRPRMLPQLLAAGLFLALTGSMPLSADCTLKQTTVEGEPAIILENDFVRLRARPTLGGRLDEFFYKPADKHLTSRTEGAVFMERVWNYASRDVYNQWQSGVYSYEVEQGPQRVAVKMTCPGTVGVGKRMTFEKTISLTAGSSAVRADYRFSIGQEAMVPMRAGLWWHNRLGVPQEATTYFVPTAEGVQSVTYGAGGGGEYWWNDPARGWTAALSESATGVAAIMDFPPLMCFYHYMGGDVSTAEWAFRSQEIPNGGSVETTIWLLPFVGKGAVAGAGPRVVAQVEAPAQSDAPGQVMATVLLAAPVPWTARVEMSLKRLPDGAPQNLEPWSAQLSPTQSAERQVALNLDQPGTYVLTGRVLDGEKLAADFFHQIVVGESSGQIAIEPLEERVGRVGERFSDKIAAKGSGPKDRAPSEEIVTPHVEWAKPYAKGPVKALIINDLLVGRETVELAERLEMDYVAPTITTGYAISATRGMFGVQMTVDQVMDNVRTCLQKDYDVILIGGLSAGIFPEDIIETILDKVKAGTGLVWANPSDCSDALWEALPFEGFAGGSRPEASWHAETEHYLTAGIPWGVLPPTETSRYKESGEVLARADKHPLVAVNDYGKGRVVGLGYSTSWQGPGSYSNGLTPWIQFAPTKFAYWEYYHSLLAKCLVWAGRKEPDLQIKHISVEPQEPVQDADKPVLNLSLDNAGALAQLTAKVRIVDEFGAAEQSFERNIKADAGGSEVAIELPAVRVGGLHLVDVILQSAGKVVDWGTTWFRVAPRVEVAGLTVEDKMYRKGDTVQAQVKLLAIEPNAGEVQLVASLRDAYGRLIAQEAKTLPAVGEAEVGLILPEPVANTATVRVEARDERGLLDAAEQKILTMPTAWYEREWGPYLSSLWGTPAGAYSREYLVPYASQRVKDLGIDTVVTGSNWLHDGEQRNSYEAGFRSLLMSVVGNVLRLSKVPEGKLNFQQQREQYTKTHDKKFLERPSCLNADDTRQMVAEKLAKITAAVAKYRPAGYVCGDELSVTYYVTPFDYDFTPGCLEKFREWLKEQYPNLSALNDEWGTDFATWEQVMPMTAEEVRDRANYAPWADHRTFMEVTFANFFRFTDHALEQGDPGARLGISGSQAAEAYGGYDWWRLTDALDFIQAYDHQNTGEMHRSFHDMLTAPWWGYASTGAGLEHTLWRRLLNDNDGGSFFVYTYIFWPDYTYTQSTLDAKEYLADIQGGLARLLHECDERATDVYVHYSHPSIHAAFITGGQTLFRDNRNGWIKAIEDSGLQMKFLAYAQLEAGELTRLMPKAFVLPYSVALSDAEAAEIHRYVEAGGTLIADARTGLMDEHCRPRVSGALDDLFGIKRASIDPKAKRPEGEARFTQALEGCDPRDISFEGFGGEPGITLDGGQALGEMAGLPALVVNRVGKGRVVLLNLLLDSYPRRRSVGVGEPMRQLVAKVLTLAGVKPEVEAQVSGDHHLYIARYLSGGATYVGVLRDTSEGRSPVKLRFAKPAHVYDLRQGQYLGKTAQTEALVRPGHCKVYSLLPYEVTGVKVRVRKADSKPGDAVKFTVTVEARGAKPGMHVCRVEVTDPAGVVRPYYGAQLTAQRGLATGEFDLALNDPTGAWTITATDVATGVTGAGEFTVAE